MTAILPTSPLHVKEVDSTQIQSELTTSNKQGRERLSACWEMVDNKLVCKWLLIE